MRSYEETAARVRQGIKTREVKEDSRCRILSVTAAFCTVAVLTLALGGGLLTKDPASVSPKSTQSIASAECIRLEPEKGIALVTAYYDAVSVSQEEEKDLCAADYPYYEGGRTSHELMDAVFWEDILTGMKQFEGTDQRLYVEVYFQPQSWWYDYTYNGVEYHEVERQMVPYEQYMSMLEKLVNLLPPTGEPMPSGETVDSEMEDFFAKEGFSFDYSAYFHDGMLDAKKIKEDNFVILGIWNKFLTTQKQMEWRILNEHRIPKKDLQCLEELGYTIYREVFHSHEICGTYDTLKDLKEDLLAGTPSINWDGLRFNLWRVDYEYPDYFSPYYVAPVFD